MIKIKNISHTVEFVLPNDYFNKDYQANISAGTIEIYPPILQGEAATCDINSIRVYTEKYEELPIVLPKLQAKVRSDNQHMYLSNFGLRVRLFDKIFVMWNNPVNLEFLNHNPRIWLFTFKSSKKKLEKTRKKGWRHPQHLKTLPFPGSKFYNSTMTKHPCPEILASGRHTEFYLSANEGEWNVIDFKADEWFFNRQDNNNSRKLTGTVINELLAGLVDKVGSTCDRQNWLINTNHRSKAKKTFRFAIVCDNPNYTLTNEQSPVIIGPLSDNVRVYFDIKIQ